MLKDIYNGRREIIDDIIKRCIKKVESKLYKIDYEENKEVIEKIEENYSIKLTAICEEVYIQGLKDGIKLIEECKNNKLNI